jgi:hypothetical protein
MGLEWDIGALVKIQTLPFHTCCISRVVGVPSDAVSLFAPGYWDNDTGKSSLFMGHGLCVCSLIKLNPDFEMDRWDLRGVPPVLVSDVTCQVKTPVGGVRIALAWSLC